MHMHTHSHAPSLALAVERALLALTYAFLYVRIRRSLSLSLSVSVFTAIDYRALQERLNVWVALLNLENTYGDHASLMRVFERAIAANEPKKVYMHLAGIYERTDKAEVRSTSIRMYACMYVCVYVCVCECMYIGPRKCEWEGGGGVRVYIFALWALAYVCISAWPCVHGCLYDCAYAPVCMFVCVYIGPLTPSGGMGQSALELFEAMTKKFRESSKVRPAAMLPTHPTHY
jgi:hypothetical protein